MYTLRNFSYTQHIACNLEEYSNVVYAPTIAASNMLEREEVNPVQSEDTKTTKPSSINNIGESRLHSEVVVKI